MGCKSCLLFGLIEIGWFLKEVDIVAIVEGHFPRKEITWKATQALLGSGPNRVIGTGNVRRRRVLGWWHGRVGNFRDACNNYRVGLNFGMMAGGQVHITAD
jgi:hypothetical protein